MAKSNARLELTWIGKENRPKLEPRVLIEDPAKSYHAKHRVSENDIFDNRLIFGDNLLALKALEQEFTGKIKCIYIDPPYNTGSAFSHYDDGVEHSLWLSLMRDRFELLRELLSPDGVLFVSIDDSELAYLIVLLDEIFGRKNSCGMFVWEKKKKPSFLNSNMGVVTEYIVAYARDRRLSPAFIGGLTTRGKKYPLNNAGNGVKTLTFPVGSVQFRCPDQVFEPQDMSGGNIITELLDRVEVKNGTNTAPFRLRGEWRYSQSKLDSIIAAGESIVISRAPFRPNHIKQGGEPKKLKNLLSIAHYGMSTYEDATAESRALFGEAEAFDYPKPEKLIQTLLAAVTEEGDLVMDSFAGSGTTGAVAHKMGRRWIMVELGEHCHTHIIPRMKKVIDGEDPGGITKAVNWKGGGGFRYYRLGPSLIVQDQWGNPVINPQFNAAMLAEAMCKLEGFTFDPNPDVYWQQGRSSENDFIYVTTQMMTREMLTKLSDEVGPNRSLLICCSAFRCDVSRFENLTVKKIPKAVLKKCEWGKDDYSLEIKNLPAAPPAEEPADDLAVVGDGNEPARKPAQPRRKFGKGKDSGPVLFDMDGTGAKGGK